MQELDDARAERLGTIREIIESCGTAGLPIDIDAITEILKEALDTLGPEPPTLRALNEEEQRALCALTTVIAAIRNLTWYMAQGMKAGRQRGRLEELPERIGKFVDVAILPRLELMPRMQVAALMGEASKWAYVIWSPAEQLAMFDILDAAAAGKYVPKAKRDQALGFLERYRRSMPMGDQHLKEEKRRASGDD